MVALQFAMKMEFGILFWPSSTVINSYGWSAFGTEVDTVCVRHFNWSGHWGSSPKPRFEPYFGELKPLWGSLGEVIYCLITQSKLILVKPFNDIIDQYDESYPKMQ